MAMAVLNVTMSLNAFANVGRSDEGVRVQGFYLRRGPWIVWRKSKQGDARQQQWVEGSGNKWWCTASRL